MDGGDAARRREPRPPGHRLLPHTADLIVEAWGPNEAACLRAAVLGLVDAFADADPSAEPRWVPLQAEGDDAEGLLVSVLDEVVFLMDSEGLIPVDAVVTTGDDGRSARGSLGVVGLDRVTVRGSAPKAISYNGLRFAPDDDGFSCRFTVDV